jgi:hypothetical protein
MIALERALRIGGEDEGEDDDLWADLDAHRPRRSGVDK